MVLVLVLLTKFALLTLLIDLGALIWLVSLLWAQLCSRLWAVGLTVCLPYQSAPQDVRFSALAQEKVGFKTGLVSISWCAGLVALGVAWMWWVDMQSLLWPVSKLLLWGFVSSGALWAVWVVRLRRRAQTYNGVSLGAVQQVTEVACLLGVALGLSTL